MPGRSQRHVDSLDGLRGLAVIAVLLFHGGHLRGGFLGVDLFFALSGFLITSLILRECGETGGVDLIGFWGRRARRLMPAVMVFLVVVTLLSIPFGTAVQRAGAVNDGPWVQLYLQNWRLLHDSGGYWASFQLPRLFSHLWSLAVEEQFYLVWPVVVWLIARRTKDTLHRTVLVVSGLGVLASFAVMQILFEGADPSRVYMGTDTRAFSLLAGAMLATRPARHWLRHTVRTRARATRLGVVLLAGIVTMWFLADGPNSAWLFRGGLLLHSLASAVLVALCVASRGSRLDRVLAWRPLAWIGSISYGLYLWHWPLFVLLHDHLSVRGWPLFAVQVAVSIAAAIVSYWLVEVPVRYRWAASQGRAGLVTGIVASLLLGAFWVVVPRLDDNPAPFALASTTALGATTTGPSAGSAPTTSLRSLPSTTAPSTSAPSTTTTTTTATSNPGPTIRATGPLSSIDGRVPAVSSSSAATSSSSAATSSTATPATSTATSTPASSTAATSTPAASATTTTSASATTSAPAPTTSTTTTTTAPTAAGSTAPAATTAPTAGTGPSATASTGAPAKRELKAVLWLGDSVAYDEAPALVAGMYTSGVNFINDAAYGTGLALDDASLTRYSAQVRQAQANLVIYQISLWDVADLALVRERYLRFAELVVATGATLVFVTPPPLRVDQRRPGLEQLPGIAAALAAAHPEQIFVWDSSEAWGPDFTRDRNKDGVPERKPDGVHVCPQGAAQFTVWLQLHMAAMYRFTPADPARWLNGSWVRDSRYRRPAGICADTKG